MASTLTAVKQAWRTLIWLVVILAVLAGTIAGGVLLNAPGASWGLKLGLDLEGGTQIILAPKLESGQQVSGEQLSQAVSIIRQRVDASGVSEAEISTQGGQNIVVSIPGTPDQDTLNRIESSAKLEFRPVLIADAAPTAAVTPTATPAEGLADTPTVAPTDASDLNWITPALQDEFTNFSCDSTEAQDAGQAPANEPLLACEGGTVKYILGPVEVTGEMISDATSGVATTQTGASTGQWVVNIVFNGEGTEKFAEVTTRLAALTGTQNQFAIVLDGQVISAPTTNAVITDGRPQISGSFTEDTAKSLADQLKFGALPIGFTVQSNDSVSATLGSSQLLSGLIAGLIGLILVVIYSLFQYRTLGLVTVASLVVAGILTYLVIALMSWRIDFRLSLAGVAGLIVAIGFTADSFIVYFERIRDELRDGKGLASAVEAGWRRAKRTIYAAKAVNLLSAVVLYVLAVGNVRGFALTLGVTTIIDVLVVILFTHPVLRLLATTKFFSSGHKASGLDPTALGAIYRGRAEFRKPTESIATKKAGAGREAALRQTIAERKAAQLTAEKPADTKKDGKDS